MSAWINHIKEFAKTSGKSYSACLKDPECKKGYTPVERKASANPRVKTAGTSRQPRPQAELKQPLEKVEPKEGEAPVKEKKPRAPRKKKDEATLEIVYDKEVPEKKKRFKKVSPPMKLKNDYAEQE